MKQENRLVVADKGWLESAPEWLLKEVETERLVQGFAALLDKSQETVGDAEACLYLYTLGLVQPMTHEYTQIYLYLASRLMQKRGTKVPDDIKVVELSDYEQHELKDLKYQLYVKRGREIKSPLFDILREFKKSCKRRGVDTNGTDISPRREETDIVRRDVSDEEPCKGSVYN